MTEREIQLCRLARQIGDAARLIDANFELRGYSSQRETELVAELQPILNHIQSEYPAAMLAFEHSARDSG